MFTIKERVVNEIIMNKSRFITLLIRVHDVHSIKEELENIKKEYKCATHYCYAYIINDKKKSSDDGEPGGTAGVPMMEILNKHSLNYCLCVVVRYFGGTKLGAGGLIRAYGKSVNEAIKKTELLEIVDGFKISLFIKYEEKQKLEKIIGSSETLYEYGDSIKCTVFCREDMKEKINASFTSGEYEKVQIFERKKDII